MAESKQILLNAYKAVESNLRKAGASTFMDQTLSSTSQKLASKLICSTLLKKMQSEMLQGRLLELKNDLIRSGVRQTEICDPTIEALERLFSENGLHVYTYITNLMIVLMRRTAIGAEYVGNKNPEKILDLYLEVSKPYYQKDFDNFKMAFKDLINPGTSICDFIYAKMHQYLSYHYRYQGPKSQGILMMAKYLKLRVQFSMFVKLENLLAEVLLLAVQALDYDLCMFRQARHLISVVYAYLKRMALKPEYAEKSNELKLLKQLTILIESLHLGINLQRSYENIIKQNTVHCFVDKYEKFKDEDIEEIDLPIRLARNQTEIQKLYEKLCGYKTYVDEPTLCTIFSAIKTSVEALPFFLKY